MSGFGQCEACGNGVERVGWDSLCFACQDDEREMFDAQAERLAEEDHFLYAIPWDGEDDAT